MSRILILLNSLSLTRV